MFNVPDLPFNPESLTGFISKNTVNFHYEKHHKGYAAKANDAVKGTNYENMTIEEIIKHAFKVNDAAVFNNVAQFYNHNLYWFGFDDSSDKTMPSEFENILIKNFESVEKFKQEFTSQSKTLFGSGWVWLSKDQNNKLYITSTHNADNPLTDNKTPILTLDVWEHAYYLDYQNLRPNYVDKFFDYVNWNKVYERFLK
jgi:Fe-Mn family superoxide dismutase